VRKNFLFHPSENVCIFLYIIFLCSLKKEKLNNILPILNENNFSPRIIYTAKLSFKTDRERKPSMINRN
jgi:hypothetical protein